MQHFQKDGWGFCLPINPRFLFKQFVKLEHFDPRYDVDFEFGQQLTEQPEVVVNLALSVSPHAAAGSPEDVRRVLAGVEQLLPAA